MKANCILGKNTATSLRKVILLCSAIVRPYLEYYVQFWLTSTGQPLTCTSNSREGPRRWSAVRAQNTWRRLRELGLFSLQKAQVRDRFQCDLQLPKEKSVGRKKYRKDSQVLLRGKRPKATDK